ncbi:hypothetical protein B0J11DRAFT_184166 [Dendryphion nanum]|uniref:Uncharacterized protein n=1 Tax=Dendryphion nanum TaxID=256645 RepID=A0A9P9D4X2_9PLEO|nr:hypothetical protein B0J11DRAFT_184166 [Dendryphion nanum]
MRNNPTFLGVPPEIRLLVYEFLFLADGVVDIGDQRNFTPALAQGTPKNLGLDVSLLQVCQQVYSEAAPILYRNHFVTHRYLFSHKRSDHPRSELQDFTSRIANKPWRVTEYIHYHWSPDGKFVCSWGPEERAKYRSDSRIDFHVLPCVMLIRKFPKCILELIPNCECLWLGPITLVNAIRGIANHVLILRYIDLGLVYAIILARNGLNGGVIFQPKSPSSNTRWDHLWKQEFTFNPEDNQLTFGHAKVPNLVDLHPDILHKIIRYALEPSRTIDIDRNEVVNLPQGLYANEYLSRLGATIYCSHHEFTKTIEIGTDEFEFPSNHYFLYQRMSPSGKIVGRRFRILFCCNIEGVRLEDLRIRLCKHGKPKDIRRPQRHRLHTSDSIDICFTVTNGSTYTTRLIHQRRWIKHGLINGRGMSVE